MKTTLRRMTLAAALLSASMPASADQGDASVGDLAGFSEAGHAAQEASVERQASASPGAGSQAFIGDSFVGDSIEGLFAADRDASSMHVGDELPAGALGGHRQGEFRAIGSEAEQAWPELEFSPDEGSEATAASQDSPQFSPISHSDLKPLQSSSSQFHAVPNGYRMQTGSACDNSCDSGCCGSIGAAVKRRGDAWARAELLLWFPEQRNLPPLVSTAPAGVAPQLDQAGAEVAFGGDVGGDLSPGFRIDAGRYLTDRFAIGGRFWILSQDSENFSLEGNGTGTSIGRPFFNTDLPGPDSILVNLDGLFRGSIAVESELEMLAAEAYGKLTLGSSKCHQVSLIGGYTHFNIDDRLWAVSRTIDTSSGTANNFIDEFEAENRFHGGQLGLEAVLTRGCWTLTSLTKVHLGNMNQQMRIEGRSSVVTTAPTVSTFDSGALALGAQGEFERDEFAFAPELNLNLAYRFRPNVSLSIGYSFIYFDNVALAGNQVDPIFSGSSILTNGPFGQPAFEFNDGSLWVQGVDLGVVLNF